MRQSSQFFCVQQELKSQMFEFNEQTTVPVLMYFQCLDKKIVEKQSYSHKICVTNIRGFGATHHQHFEDNFFSAQRNIYSFQFLHLWSNFEICFFQKGPTTFLPFVITIYILQFLFFNLITSPILRKVIFFQFRCTLTTSKVEFPLHWNLPVHVHIMIFLTGRKTSN